MSGLGACRHVKMLHSTLTFVSRPSFTRRRNSIHSLFENFCLKIIHRGQIILAFTLHKYTDILRGGGGGGWLITC